MHTIGSQRKYKPGQTVWLDKIPYKVVSCRPTRHIGWWQLELKPASTSTDIETPDGLFADGLAHSKDYSKTKFSGPEAAYYWSLANVSGGDSTEVASFEQDGISVLMFTPTEDEKEYFGIKDEEIYLIEDEQGFVSTSDRWTGYRPEEDLHEEGDEE